MSVIPNSWIEKCKKKKEAETAPSFESNPLAESEIYNTKKPLKRFTIAARSVVMRTLRGIRK
jgi:hypothetical protein